MIDLTANALFFIGPVPVTNTFLASIIISLLLIAIAYNIYKHISLVPGKLQNVVEFIIEFMYNTALDVVGDEKRTEVFFPLVATFFIFILFSNWFGLLPIFGTILVHTKEGMVPLFRTMNSDLNSTLALALISTVATQYYAIKYMGLKQHLLRYFSWNPINLFVGILELLSEVTKVVSLSFRLYGNILAGDIVISTFTSFVGLLVPLPFMGLELVVGFVQAAVFAMLTLSFTNVLTQKLH